MMEDRQVPCRLRPLAPGSSLAPDKSLLPAPPQGLPTRGWFCNVWGRLCNVWRQFLFVPSRMALWFLLCQGQGCCYTSLVPRAGPLAEDYLASNVNSTKK